MKPKPMKSKNSDRVLLTAKDLTVGYAQAPVLHIAFLALSSGECLVLQGANGSGKSTLVKTILGLLPTLAGSIERRSRRLAYVPQREPVAELIPLTLYDYVALGYTARSSKDGPGRINLTTLLDELELMDCRDLRIGHASAGQFQRALLARALLAEPELLILDEPSASLDDRAAKQVLKQIKHCQSRGVAVLLVTHDARMIGKHVTQTWRAHGGYLRKEYSKKRKNNRNSDNKGTTQA